MTHRERGAGGHIYGVCISSCLCVQSTKMLAESKLRMDVIYGDTDSIMVSQLSS